MEQQYDSYWNLSVHHFFLIGKKTFPNREKNNALRIIGFYTLISRAFSLIRQLTKLLNMK